ncbi:ovostatin isoform X1 [Pogona vitticeps]
MALWFFLVTFLFHLSAAEPPELQYVLIVPSVVQSSVSNEACVHLLHLNEGIFLNVTLEYNTESYPLWKGSVTPSHFSQCFSFTVPPAASNALAFIILSAKGSSVDIYERRSVAIRNISTALFIQTDKPIYKPGQTMKFRVVTLDSNFKPVNKVYPLIYVQDPQGNRIAQWLNQAPSHGILQLELQIFQDTHLGSYQITVHDDDKPNYSTSQWFSVEEYVPPKFEVTMEAPQRVSPFDEEFEVNICARYTYGKPVRGKVQLRVCRNRYYHPRCDRDSNGICEVIHTELGKEGCVSKTIRTKAFHLYTNLDRNRFFFVSLHAEAIVTENGTGIQMSHTRYISVYETRKTIGFDKMDSYYKRGIPLTGQVILRDEDDKPLEGGLIFLEFDGDIVNNYTTDKNGIAQFSIQTSKMFQPRYKLRAFYQPDQCTDYGWLETYQPEAIHYVQRFFSRSESFVKIEPVWEELPCGKKRTITVHYILSKNLHRDIQTDNVYFYHALVAKGKIVQGGTQLVRTRYGKYSTFSITLNIDQKLAPRARLLVYSLQPHCDLIADSIFLQIEKCFRNKVGLTFSDKQVLPASDVSLLLTASNNSFCALRGVDQSVLLLRPGAELSPEYVFNQMPYLDLWGYNYMGTNLEDDPKEPCIEIRDTFFNGLYHVPVNVTDDGNVFDILESMGLKAFTKCTLRKPVVCRSDYECKKISSDDSPPPPPPYLGKYQEKTAAFGASGDRLIETVRTSFPETWLWNTVHVSSSGKASLSYIVPDTITEWKVNAFCVQDSDGFGLSETASLITFQPFFVEPKLPYSTIRGEEFIYIANIFNYQPNCIEITAFLEESSDFRAEKLSPDNNVSMICANETISYTWRIHPQRLGTVNFTVTAEAKADEVSVGRRDTVVLPLLVEPEGVKKEETYSSLICAKGTPVSELLTLTLPANLVEGSARASFSVLGDIMGTAMKNSENLLQMPYGCAEQNIAMFLSNLIILNYLENTKQLTEEKKSRIVGHLTGGYQRQLSYRLFDGSFSTFGSRDAQGNLWLTAVVYKAFARSKPHVYIDDNVLNQALVWIASKQEADGCFQPDRTIYNNALKDGTDYRLLTTTFVTASLLESGVLQSDPVVRRGLSCLAAASDGGLRSTYENALLAYTYGLAGDAEKQQPILDALLQTATRMGGFIYWEREKRPQGEKPSSFYLRAPSVEIAMTSYILMAWLKQSNFSQEDLVLASQCARWIVRQQNPNGGFSSSQDTPVALQALSQFGSLTFTKDAQNTVTITGAGGTFKKTFQADSSNSILLQQIALPSAQSNYSVEVHGSGCVYTQTTLKYNIILPAQASGFALSVQTRNASCTGEFPPRFDVVITTSYTGERNTSNMAIIDLKLLSGFAPDQSSLQKLHDKVMRTESKNDHLFFYLNHVSKNDTTFSLTLEQTHPVSNSKPAQVKIYDYYETDESAQTEYNTPCQEASD